MHQSAETKEEQVKQVPAAPLQSPDSLHNHHHHHRKKHGHGHDKHHHSDEKRHHHHYPPRKLEERNEKMLSSSKTKKELNAPHPSSKDRTKVGGKEEPSSSDIIRVHTSETMMIQALSEEEATHGRISMDGHMEYDVPGAFRVGGSDRTSFADSLLDIDRDLEQCILPTNSGELAVEAHKVVEPIIVPAEPFDPDQGKQQDPANGRSWWCTFAFVRIAAFCIAIVVMISMMITKEPLPSARLLNLIKSLALISPDGGQALSYPSSPQYRAAKWLSEESSFTSYSNLEIIQRFVLATLYYSTNGVNWNSSKNWLTGSSECTWEITHASKPICNEDGHVKSLILNKNDLQGHLPVELVLLAESLERIEMKNQLLSGTLPTEFGLLSNTGRLELTLNHQLRGTLPTELGSMTALSFLGVGRMGMSGTLPSEVGRLTALKTLGMEGGGFSGTIPTELGQTALDDVALNGNNLTGKVPQSLLWLPTLSTANGTLKLQRNSLTGEIVLSNGNKCSIGTLIADCVKEVDCECCTLCCDDENDTDVC